MNLIPPIISALFTLWMPDCVPVVNPITVTVEREGTSYISGSHEIYVEDEEMRFYNLDSPFLDRQHGRLQQLAWAISQNDAAFLDWLLTRHDDCTSLPEGRERG